MEPAVLAENLTFAYGTVPVLKNVSLAVRRGTFTVILGRNGSGKSTLLRILSGMAGYETGSVRIHGAELNTLSLSERAKIIGYLPQFHTPVFPFTVSDVVLTGRAAFAFPLPRLHDREKAETAIERAGISHLRTKAYTELSGGERQLVMIARVLAQEPSVILLDEPLSHLDLANQVRLIDILREIVGTGVTVVAVLHDPNTAILAADTQLFMKDGIIAGERESGGGTEAELLSDIYGTPLLSVPFSGKHIVMPDYGKRGIMPDFS